MNLDELTIAIRPRRDWEAVDLGILMARRWWWPMTKVWCLLTLPLLLAGLVVPLHWLPWVPVMLWWLKPLFERPLLMILSHGVFGEQLSTRQVLKSTPGLFFRQILPSLTWRRFSPYRSMDAPVIQLERLGGAARQSRLNVLHREGHAPAKWLTLIGVHLESFLMLGLFALLPLFIPSELQADIFDFEFWFAARSGLLVQGLFYYFAVAAVAPFYVACGFSLYLNRRIKLEGWDIEIAFKQMLSKRRLTGSIAALLLCLGTFSFTPEQAQAQSGEPDTAQTTADRQRVQTQIQQVLAGEDFHQTRQQKVLRFKPQDSEAESDSTDISWLKPLLKALGQLMSAIAAVAEVVLWAVVIAAAVYFGVRYRHLLRALGRWRPARKAAFTPQTLFGMEVSQESLPENISASAEALWQQQDYRAALALLYRASLAALLQRGLALRDGNTEGECLRLARQEAGEIGLAPSTLAYFEQLTQAWQGLAYAHRRPEHDRGQQLCQRWNALWSEAADGR